MTMKTTVCFLSSLFLLAPGLVPWGSAQEPSAAARPELVRGELRVRSITGPLDAELRDLADGWAGYAVPMVAGHHHFCDGGVVSLDGPRRYRDRESPSGGALFVLHRVERGRVVEIETLGSGCRLDAGANADSNAIVWLEGVTERESLVLLEHLVRGGEAPRDVAEDAVTAIAFHLDLEADRVLGELSASAPHRDAREKAIFWLGAARGEGGFSWLVRRMNAETDRELKEKIVFALHVSEAPESTEKLVELARRDPDSEVREKALFWLSQEAGELAARAIATSAVEDPDVEVKKKAVFALSQLPADEGIPLLLEVAETHPNPEVRKKAFFWLGQTGDPRAAALFEKILLAK